MNDPAVEKARLAAAVDAELPQAQCGRCGYATCARYALALLEDEVSIELCSPGGVGTRRALAKLLGRPTSSPSAVAEKLHLVTIVESGCIGCGKCADICPVDAIVGARGLLFGVVDDWCTGCEICVPICPTDCIELRPTDVRDDELARRERARAALARYDAKRSRGAHQSGGLVYAEPDGYSAAGLRDAVQAAVARKRADAPRTPKCTDSDS